MAKKVLKPQAHALEESSRAGLTEPQEANSIADTTSPDSEPVMVKLPQIAVIENYLKKKYEFRFNLVTGRLEYKMKGAAEFILLNDYKLNSVFRDLKMNRINTSIGELRAILNSDFVPTYDPFVSYFDSLPIWDTKTDYIESLAATISTTNDNLWKRCFKRWLVAMVASAIDEMIVNHTVVVFSGKQGLGKTTWMLNLIPGELKKYVFSGTINPSNKDTLIQISECILINMDELESMSKSQIGELKELITKQAIRIRRAYGFHTENLVRRASFAGSVNDKEFLNDSTGNRRFLCFEVLNIQYEHGINMNQVFSQAVQLFKSGYQYWFDKKDIEEISANNDQFQSVSFEEELLLTYYEPIPKEMASLFLSTTDIASNLAEFRKFSITNTTKQNLGRALQKHKFLRLKKQGRYVYALRLKSLKISTVLPDLLSAEPIKN